MDINDQEFRVLSTTVPHAGQLLLQLKLTVVDPDVGSIRLGCHTGIHLGTMGNSG